jgi:hypothetical protein
MTIPLNATQFRQQMDPADVVDYVADAYDTSDPAKTPLLEAGESIVSYTLTMSAEGTALGVTIESVAPRAPALINSNKAIKFWLSVTSGFQTNVAFDGAGTLIPILVTIDTDMSRRRQRTVVVQVAQQ